MPARHATTRAARYVIGTAVGWVARGVDQSRARGSWLSLGTYELATEVAVRLSARTGDPRGSRRTVAFDALRFVPLESPPPPVISDIDVEARTTAPSCASASTRGVPRGPSTASRVPSTGAPGPRRRAASTPTTARSSTACAPRPPTSCASSPATPVGGPSATSCASARPRCRPPSSATSRSSPLRDQRRGALRPRRAGSRPRRVPHRRDRRVAPRRRGDERRLREPPHGHRRPAAGDPLRTAHRRQQRGGHDGQRQRGLPDRSAHRRLHSRRGPPARHRRGQGRGHPAHPRPLQPSGCHHHRQGPDAEGRLGGRWHPASVGDTASVASSTWGHRPARIPESGAARDGRGHLSETSVSPT